MKVKKAFFCIQEKKVYNVGDQYTGERKDLSHFLEQEIEDKSMKIKRKTKKR